MNPIAPPKGFATSALLAALFAALLCGVSACASEEGTTPTCTQDVDEDGHNQVPNGCNPFAICEKNPSNPAACCEGRSGYELEACLYGYGAGPKPGSGS
jgi:hypothetical protein